MRLGKLTADELQKYIIDKISRHRAEVVLSSALGEDCASLKIDDFILLSSDPITSKVDINLLGTLAVDVSTNDIIANGGEPVAIMLTIIMPPSQNPADISIIMDSAKNRCQMLNIDIIGGHTEFSDSVTRPIVSATAIGKTKRIIKKSDLKAGDKLYVTKYIGLEGTVLLHHKLDNLSDLEKIEIAEIKNNLSILSEGKILSNSENITIMHDITEGGIIGAVYEVLHSSDLGAMIYQKDIPLLDVTKKICNTLNVNPYKLISSGSILFAGKNLEKTVQLLNSNGINAVCVGEVLKDKSIRQFVYKDGKTENLSSEMDELYKV